MSTEGASAGISAEITLSAAALIAPMAVGVIKFPAGFVALRAYAFPADFLFSDGSGGPTTVSSFSAFDGKLSFQTSREDCGVCGAMGDDVI